MLTVMVTALKIKENPPHQIFTLRWVNAPEGASKTI